MCLREAELSTCSGVVQRMHVTAGECVVRCMYMGVCVHEQRAQVRGMHMGICVCVLAQVASHGVGLTRFGVLRLGMRRGQPARLGRAGTAVALTGDGMGWTAQLQAHRLQGT